MRGRDAGLVTGVTARRTRSASEHLDVAVDTVFGLKGPVTKTLAWKRSTRRSRP
jgi:hypothetical protein